MDSPQSVVSPLKGSMLSQPENQKSDFYPRNSHPLSKEIGVNRNVTHGVDLKDFIGVLDVNIHQARDIHNICIYQKQDVYAKLCLTNNPEKTVSTKIINGGGRNPVFNETLRLHVRTIESLLKCEIWMLSRVKNYLEDQLLGFALVPLSEVLIKNGKLEKEFSLSSTDLFHSPAGFVQLSISYDGSSPDVIAIPAISLGLNTAANVQDSQITESLTSDLDKIEFPDPKMVNEDQIMVSEYFGIQCTDLDNQSSESLVTSDRENNINSEGGFHAVENVSTGTVESAQIPNMNSPYSSVSTNGVYSPSVQASTESSGTVDCLKSPNQEQVSSLKEKTKDVKDGGSGESDSSNGVPRETITKPMVTVNIEPEQTVVQQEIVDMYMKSMQQFTESLAKMKLPLDIEPGPPSSNDSGNSSSEPKSQTQTPKSNGSRVFYGSRAFF